MLKKKEKLRTSTSLHAVTVVFKKVYTTEGLSHWRYFIKFSVCVRKASTKMHFFQHIHTDPRLLHTCISMSWDHTPRRVTFLFTLLFLSLTLMHARNILPFGFHIIMSLHGSFSGIIPVVLQDLKVQPQRYHHRICFLINIHPFDSLVAPPSQCARKDSPFRNHGCMQQCES